MISKEQAAKLKRLIAKNRHAYEDVSWIGAGDPDDAEEVMKRFYKSSKKLRDFIQELTEEKK